ncbi:MAG: ATP synthase F1 subunit epsilon [Anaerolineae bacterium]|uniref:ATP synthase F1 subunit epsilon n=1 Tax=Thermogutta sp. TaxID=1962930 RepID=UPI00322057AC
MAELRCIVVTPERKVLEDTADAVVVPLPDGELGIYPRHAPLIARLGAGELRVRQEEKVRRFYIEGGFVEVLNDVVSVVTTRTFTARELAPDVIHQQLEQVIQARAAGDEAIAERNARAARLRAMLRVARRGE